MTGFARLAAVLSVLLGLLAPSALAASLDEARAAGLVGERIDGYLGVVDPGAPSDVKALVEQINAQRKAKYQKIADKQGAPLAAVAQIAGTKLIERAPKGQHIMGADGKWTTK